MKNLSLFKGFYLSDCLNQFVQECQCISICLGWIDTFFHSCHSLIRKRKDHIFKHNDKFIPFVPIKNIGIATDVQKFTTDFCVYLCHSLALLNGFGFKRNGKLGVIVLASHIQAAVLVTCLQVFHIEKVAANVPLAIPKHEVFGVMTFQTIEGMYTSTKHFAVIEAAYPLLSSENKETIFADNPFTTHDSHKCVNHENSEEWIKPHCKSNSNAIVGTPCSLLEVGAVTFSCYDKVGILCTENLRYTLGLIKGVTNSTYHFQCCEKGFSFLSFCPVVNLLSITFGHGSKVYLTIVTLAFNRHIQTVNLDDFNHTFFGTHNIKSYDIKEKPPVGVRTTFYDGRMKLPVVSFRPP